MKYLISVMVTLSLVLIPLSGAERTGFSDSSCDKNGQCTLEMYSYQKYYDDKGEWKEINEDWSTQGCQVGYTYCNIANPQNYQVHVKSDIAQPEAVLIISEEGERIIFTPTGIEDSRGVLSTIQSVTPRVDGNQLVYTDILPSTTLILKYLPHELKEELVIASPLPFAITGNLKFTNTLSTTLTYNSNERKEEGSIDFMKESTILARVPPPEADKRETVWDIKYGQLNLEVDYNSHNFKDGSLLVDPTFELDSNKIVQDGDVLLTDVTPQLLTKNSGRDHLRIGVTGCTTSPEFSRAFIDWNVSLMPSGVRLVKGELILAVQNMDDDNTNLTLSGPNFHGYQYSTINITQFGQLKGQKMGTKENILAPPVTTYNVSLSKTALRALESSIYSDKIWTVGVANSELGSRPTCPTTDTNGTQIRSSEYSLQGDRPKLVLTYEPIANETEARAAILEGVASVLTTYSTHTNQQVYTRYASGTQKLGRFDIVIKANNQRWAFNYLTGADPVINMTTMNTVFFPLEMVNMSYTEIKDEVALLINQTKN